jgi:manganese transport protein
LSFAVVPLVQFTSDARRMGEFVNARVTVVAAWTAAVLIAAANVWLIAQALR